MTDTRLDAEQRVTGDPRPEHPADPEALFEEARRRRRRRWLVGVAVLCLMAGGLAAGLAISGGGGGRLAVKSQHHPAPAAPPSAPPSSVQRQPGVALPSSALFNQISVTPDGLLLSGVTPQTATSLIQTCAAASVDPQTLSTGAIVTGSCEDPRLSGHTVEAVNTYVPDSNNATISISSVSKTTGQVIVGPVVMTYGSYSDTRPVMAYGSGWLWIYDVDTTVGPELLQVSSLSGAVVDVVPMPKLYRPLLAADDGDVWIANSIEGSEGVPALFRVASGASAPTTMVSDTGLPICWLTADGSTAWVGAGVGWDCGKQMVEKYIDGARGPVYSTSAAGFTPFWVVGDEADGLWAMAWSQPGAASSQLIFSIDPDTGIESLAATLPPVLYPDTVATNGLVQGQAAYFDGALYLLEPPFRLNGYLGYSSIVRVPASPPIALSQ